MAQNGAKFFKLSLVFVLVILSVGKIESRGSSHSSGSHSSSHSSGSHSSGSHSSFGSHSTGSHSTGSHSTGSHSTGSHIGSGISHNSGFGSSGTHHTNTGFGSGGTHHTSTGFGSGGTHSTNIGFGSGGTHHTNAGFGSGGTHSTNTGFGSGGTHHTNTGFGSGGTHPIGGSGTGFGGTHTGISGMNTHINGQQHGGLSSTHTITGGIGFTNQGGSVHSTHVNPVGGSHPSAPVGTGTNTRPIGFEHFNNQHQTGGSATNHGGTIPQTHVNPVGSGHHPTAPVSPTNVRPIGFEHMNQHPTGGVGSTHVNTVGNGNVHHSGHTPVGTHTTNNIHVTNTHITNTNTHHSNVGYHPYQSQTVAVPGGGIYYHPAVQLQYVPPVHTVHVVPFYNPPTYIHSYPSVGYSSGIGLGHGTSFLSGYLIGRASGSLDNGYYNHNSVVHHYDSTQHVYHHNDNDYDRNDNQQQANNYYTVHNHYQNREDVPTKFSVPGTNVVECPSNTSESLCVPNTNAICLKNETIMCVTNNLLTVPCGPNNTLHCVYTRIDCNGDPSCNTTTNQTYIDFYIPCIANVTLSNNKVVNSEVFTKYPVEDSYELCVTAIAAPKKVESPVSSVAMLFIELGKFHLNQVAEMSNGTKRS